MKYIIRKKKDIRECDGCDSGQVSPIDADMAFGMGPVNPIGGPDRWDIGFRFASSLKRRKKCKIRKRK